MQVAANRAATNSKVCSSSCAASSPKAWAKAMAFVRSLGFFFGSSSSSGGANEEAINASSVEGVQMFHRAWATHLRVVTAEARIVPTSIRIWRAPLFTSAEGVSLA